MCQKADFDHFWSFPICLQFFLRKKGVVMATMSTLVHGDPNYVALLSALKEADTLYEANLLIKLIRRMKIPIGWHDGLAEALQNMFERMSLRDYHEMAEFLARKKRDAEQEEAEGLLT
jgi:hypothetical protein